MFFDFEKFPRNTNPKYWKEKAVLFFSFVTEYTGKKRHQIPNLIDENFEKTEKNFLDFQSRDIKKYNNIQIIVFSDLPDLFIQKLMNQENHKNISTLISDWRKNLKISEPERRNLFFRKLLFEPKKPKLKKILEFPLLKPTDIIIFYPPISYPTLIKKKLWIQYSSFVDADFTDFKKGFFLDVDPMDSLDRWKAHLYFFFTERWKENKQIQENIKKIQIYILFFQKNKFHKEQIWTWPTKLTPEQNKILNSIRDKWSGEPLKYPSIYDGL